MTRVAAMLAVVLVLAAMAADAAAAARNWRSYDAYPYRVSQRPVQVRKAQPFFFVFGHVFGSRAG
jgi:hypothetical protein